jgi:hypothetical protein
MQKRIGLFLPKAQSSDTSTTFLGLRKILFRGRFNYYFFLSSMNLYITRLLYDYVITTVKF